MKSIVCAVIAAVVFAKEDAPIQEEDKCQKATIKANKACSDKFGSRAATSTCKSVKTSERKACKDEENKKHDECKATVTESEKACTKEVEKMKEKACLKKVKASGKETCEKAHPGRAGSNAASQSRIRQAEIRCYEDAKNACTGSKSLANSLLTGVSVLISAALLF